MYHCIIQNPSGACAHFAHHVCSLFWSICRRLCPFHDQCSASITLRVCTTMSNVLVYLLATQEYAFPFVITLYICSCQVFSTSVCGLLCESLMRLCIPIATARCVLSLYFHFYYASKSSPLFITYISCLLLSIWFYINCFTRFFTTDHDYYRVCPFFFELVKFFRRP